MVTIKAKKRSQKASYWGNAKLIDLIQSLIEGGIMQKQNPLDEIMAVVRENAEMQKYFARERHRFTKKSLEAKLPGLIWEPRRLKLLETFVRDNWDSAEVEKRFAYLPKRILDAKIRHLRGRSQKKVPAEHVRGIFRIIPDGVVVKSIKIPVTTLENPIVVPETASGILPLAAPMIGLPYPGTMAQNVFRCAMEFAQRENLAVVLTGGLLYLNMKQMHANTRNKNARTSGIDLDLDVINPGYREIVEDIMKSGKDVPIFTTFIENFENLLSGLRKILFHSEESGGAPRFTIPLYFQLGAAEEEIVTSCATSEIRYKTNQRLRELGTEIRKAKALLRADPHNEGLMREIAKRQDEVDRTIQTYVSDDNHGRAYERMRSYIVGKLMESLPGAQLVGSCESYMSYFGKTFRFKESGDDKMSANLLDAYIQMEGNHLTKAGELADVEILVNRWNVHAAGSLLDNTKYNALRASLVLSLPPAIDGNYIRGTFKKRGLHGKSTPIQRFVGSPFFKAGALVIRHASGLTPVQFYDIAAIQYLGGPNDKRIKTKEKNLGKYFTLESTSDLHSGHPWEWHVWDSVQHKHLDLTSAIFNIQRTQDGFGRVHTFGVEDDLVQGDNFPNHVQTHENVLSTEQLRKQIAVYRDLIHRAHASGNASEVERFEDALDRCILFQNIVKGEYRIENQLRKLIYGPIADNVDALADIIATHKRSGVEYRGFSIMKDLPVDSRDLPVLFLPNGNHFMHSFGDKSKCHLSEGFIIAEAAKARIALHLPKPYHEELLRDRSPLMGSPLHGQDFLGVAVVDTKKGAKIGLHVRGSPTRKGPANGFGLEQAARNSVTRGNYNGCFHDVETELQVTGDIHKGGFVIIPKYIHVSCPAATKDDPYGAKGFARSHVGGVLVSYPAVGMNYAPVQITFVPEGWVSEWYDKRFPVDFTKVIPDPL